MYESYFGLSGPPFQLNPDPAFYFNSRGHGHALAYLRYGVAQGEGFIVVTGEIGAGKTTLLRALLDELDRAQVVAAQIVSTQLESGDLLQSIVTAFGIPTQGNNKASLIATLEAFLMTLATQGRRALLVIDEAQNLEIRSIEELRMLSNFQLGTQSLLQSFLVGQPELRKKLESPEMEQLRQRVTASCHLGPLGAEETRAYVEHRLRRVGWTDRPRFEDGAFDQVYRWSGGVPRRINRLCNRLLLAAFLESRDGIDANLVEQTARELRQEIGEGSFEPLALPVRKASSTVEFNAGVPSPTAGALPPSGESTQGAVQEMGADAPDASEVLATGSAAGSDVTPRGDEGGRQPVVLVDQEQRPEPAGEVGLGTAAVQASGEAIPAAPVPFGAVGPHASVNATGTVESIEQATVADGPGIDAEAAAVPSKGDFAATLAVAEGAGAPHDSAGLPGVVRIERMSHRARRGVVLCLADTSSSALKMAAIAKVLDAHSEVPKLVLVNPGAVDDAWPWDEMESILPAPEAAVHLGVPPGSLEESAPLLFERFGAVLDEFKPLGVLALGSSDAMLACSLVAHKRGLPLLRAEAGERTQFPEERQVNAGLIEQLAEVLMVPDGPDAHQCLYRHGIPAARVFGMPGRLAADVVGAMLPSMTTPYGAFLRHRLPIFLGPRWSSEVDGTAYALVALRLPEAYSKSVAGVIDALVDVHAVPKLIWLTDESTREAVRHWQTATPHRADDVFIIEEDLPRSALDKRNSARVLCCDIRSLPDQLSVLRGAVALLSKPDHILGEAADLLGIPSVMLEAGRLWTETSPAADGADRPFGSVSLDECLRDFVSLGEPAAPVSVLAEPMAAAAAVGARLKAWADQRHDSHRPAIRDVIVERLDPARFDRPRDLLSIPA